MPRSYEVTPQVTPFTEVVYMDAITSSDDGVNFPFIPVCNTLWVEVIVTKTSGGNVNAYIFPDWVPGYSMLRVAYNIETTVTLWMLVKGVPENVATTEGSHRLGVRLVSTVSGNPGTAECKVILHGMRRGG